MDAEEIVGADHGLAPPERADARMLTEDAGDGPDEGEADAPSSGKGGGSGSSGPQRTLIIYSGPTSMDRLQDKNGMYIDNMNYFLEHGISCFDDDPESKFDDGGAEPVVVNYVFVLTQEVAAYYAGPHGPLTKKVQECKGVDKRAKGGGGDYEFIRVMTRQDRCYDMESIRTVVTNMNVQALYDSLLFVNCGLVGPKLGPGSPRLIPSSASSQRMVPYSHWSQLYTSRLTDSVRMVGHSINTHFHTFFPHVQSFLYAVRTDTVPILVSSGAIYDCGLSQAELGGNPEKRFELINRYEVGMSTTLLKQGYKIATAFVNRYGFGRSLVYDKASTWGTELDDTVSDIWYEDGIRNLTATMAKPTPTFWSREEGKPGLRSPDSLKEDTFQYHQWDILPWDYFVFFKVSRLVPQDVQDEMNYNAEELQKSDVLVVSNDPRKSPSKFWLKKTGVLVEPTDYAPLAKGAMALACLVLLGFVAKKRQVFAKKRFLPLPRRRIGKLVLRKKHGHDHET